MLCNQISAVELIKFETVLGALNAEVVIMHKEILGKFEGENIKIISLFKITRIRRLPFNYCRYINIINS